MIIYRDVLTGDELFSDLYELKPMEDAPALFTFDCKNIQVATNENVTLDGANPSAEGEDADEGGESGTVQKLDIEHSYRLNSVAKPAKKIAQAEYKSYAKALVKKLKENGKDTEAADFQTQAAAALKKILGNWDNYDLFCGESAMGEVSMWILVDYREDGVTPYATVWKHGIIEEKV